MSVSQSIAKMVQSSTLTQANIEAHHDYESNHGTPWGHFSIPAEK